MPIGVICTSWNHKWVSYRWKGVFGIVWTSEVLLCNGVLDDDVQYVIWMWTPPPYFHSFHLTSFTLCVPRPSLFFTALPHLCITLNVHQRTKTREAWNRHSLFSFTCKQYKHLQHAVLYASACTIVPKLSALLSASTFNLERVSMWSLQQLNALEQMIWQTILNFTRRFKVKSWQHTTFWTAACEHWLASVRAALLCSFMQKYLWWSITCSFLTLDMYA